MKRRTRKKQVRRWYRQHQRVDKRVHGCHLRWEWMAIRTGVKDDYEMWLAVMVPWKATGAD